MAHVVAAPDKFRGTASADEVSRAINDAAVATGWSCEWVRLSDGGEGLLDAVGGDDRVEQVTGPLGAAANAHWRTFVARDGVVTAVIEMAQASGMALVGSRDENDALAATTYGTGELMCAARESGATRIIVGCGGSATSDGGRGMLAATGGPAAWHDVELFAATDVTTPYLDAARVFGEQKGASVAEIAILSEQLQRTAVDYRSRYGVDVTTVAGAGAAGGLAGAIAALGGAVVSGFGLVADLVGLDDALAHADLVVTGEGRLDVTSLAGKVVAGVVTRAAARCPVLVVVGTSDGTSAVDLAAATGADPGRITVISLVERFGLERALSETTTLIGEIVGAQLADRAAPAPSTGSERASQRR